MMAGLGGGFLTMVSVGLFVPGITAGRGWLAIVIVIAGNWRPQRILAAALVFGFLESLQANLQGLGLEIPYQIFLALPYIVAIIFLIRGRMRSEAPLSLGVPYLRE
jgi:simple sugar transport system permease protein